MITFERFAAIQRLLDLQWRHRVGMTPAIVRWQPRGKRR